MITILSNCELEIGEIIHSISDAMGNRDDTSPSGRVIAKSTKEKYIRCIQENNGFLIHWEVNDPRALFYDVLVD